MVAIVAAPVGGYGEGEMLADHTVVIREEGRVVRLFGDRAERVSTLPSPGNDVRLQGGGGRPESVRARLDHALERRLLDPISAIATAADVLRHQVSDTQVEQVSAIADAALRADTMVRDLLNFVRSGMGGILASRRRVDLKVLCERVVDAIYSAHPDRPMVFTSDRRVEGNWDPDAIETLLSKLVLNAIAHGAPRPAIRISVRALPDAAVIEVWNGGSIADRDVREKLFEPFASASPASARSAAGLGLGLYLAREVARAHGGSIDVQSNDHDGTTFRVTLPHG